MKKGGKETNHRLSDIDTEKAMATCSICGRVKVYPRKPKFWRCSNVGIAKAKRAYHKSKDRLRDVRNAKARDRHLWVCFRLTREDLNKIEDFQKNHSIYKLLLGKLEGTDHCHKTGLVRGRLEWRINRAYGLLEKAFPDNLPDVLRALAYYHEHPPAELALGEKRYGLIGEARHKKKMVYGNPDKK